MPNHFHGILIIGQNQYNRNDGGNDDVHNDGHIDRNAMHCVSTKKSVYAKQTTKAKKNRTSNSSLCTIGYEANKTKVWSLKDLDADHVSVWSKGGETNIKN